MANKTAAKCSISDVTGFSSLLHSFWTNKSHHTRATSLTPVGYLRIFNLLRYFFKDSELKQGAIPYGMSIGARRACSSSVKAFPRDPETTCISRLQQVWGDVRVFIKKFILCCVGVLYSSDMFSESSIFFYRSNSIVFICLRQDIWEKQLKHIHTMGKKIRVSKHMECLDYRIQTPKDP